jgi:hypothetical protein
MSENPTLYPSKKPYTWPKSTATEDVEAIAARVKQLDTKGVATWLAPYTGKTPGKNADVNTFEMMSLYQQAINLLNDNIALTVDGRFGKNTHLALQDLQRSKLELTGASADGFMWPQTTTALIAALGWGEACNCTYWGKA